MTEQQDLNRLLTEWLKEHDAAIVVMAEAPSGAQIEVRSFIPKQLLVEGWRVVVNVVPVEGEKK